MISNIGYIFVYWYAVYYFHVKSDSSTSSKKSRSKLLTLTNYSQLRAINEKRKRTNIRNEIQSMFQNRNENRYALLFRIFRINSFFEDL